MTRLLLFCFLLPFLGLSQTRTVVSVIRIFPKHDKVAEFEQALTHHAQTYHTGNWKWRVYSVESGPDYGAYHITEGPVTWDELDKRGDLGEEHTRDWDKNILPLTMDKATSSYSVYREDLSTVQLSDYTDKIAITHVYPKLGRSLNVEETFKSAKKVWEEGGQTIAVYEASSSGPLQYTLVTRYKQGLKEKDRNFRKPMKERFEAVNGSGSYSKYLDDIANAGESSWSELLFYKAKLSSR